MSMSDDQPDVGSYSWSQTEDQVTISFLVPESCKSKDLDIVIETHHVKAGLKGQEPVLKAKLFAPINHFGSLWQLEKSATSPFSSLTASPSFSIASSYAFMSSPNHSPTHSPNSSMILPAPALAETNGASSTPMAELLHQTAALGSYSVSSSDDNSQPASPVAINTPPSLATPPHLQGEAQQSAPKYRLLTIHLEKDQEGLHWMVPISAGWKTDEMDIDVTSASHLGSWYEATGNLEKAFKYYESAAERGHTRSMTKLATMYEVGNEMHETR
ncbi:uncharacterized protein BYT42DRAFT_22940 [Radiomyces spectabilis]|uniref:uncharacterized protein n=1 Tax=Radiomyces spectabilis TaxID=64574 RepID=UPI0022207453|nr:uncharacterized protein BYT42DRAFT_22940 [Radiomyces spectabilis]KAI8393892.1 hypothetical protein BYT42DRAFT_22940 [Radiomyces spectabilis]